VLNLYQRTIIAKVEQLFELQHKSKYLLSDDLDSKPFGVSCRPRQSIERKTARKAVQSPFMPIPNYKEIDNILNHQNVIQDGLIPHIRHKYINSIQVASP
jgi:hypothetical protein